MSEEYQANAYMRVAQRFIQPLFIKDGLGGYNFSSTVTLIKYRNEYFFVFAAHALSIGQESIDNIGFLLTDGSFLPMSEVSKRHKIFHEHDIGICNAIAQADGKNYFDLDVQNSTTEFKTEGFGWIGFPKKKAKEQYHNTKASPEHIKKELSELDDGVLKWNNARFLCMGIDFKEINETEIIGHFEDKNVNYEIEGFKQQAYSLRGMSGGALFFGPEKINSDQPALSDLYKFSGIGLEHNVKGKTVKGASRELIMRLIDQLLDNPDT
jgi:hypothetical protein